MITLHKYIYWIPVLYIQFMHSVYGKGPKERHTFITEIILFSVTSAYIYKIIWRDLAVKI